MTGKEFIQLTERGNKAIDIALDLAKQLKKTTILIPDQGGWLHYKKAPKRFDLEIKEIKTDDGLLDLEDLEKNANKDSLLLTCSMSGYFAIDNIDQIMKTCSKKECLVINDVSGSIGTYAAKVGNILVCSFSKWKPINLEYGGFIATDNEEFYTNFDASYFEEHNYEPLLEKFDELPKRLELFQKTRKQILDELQSFKIIHKDKEGINVVIKFDDDEVKQIIIDYCKENKLEYVECPKYIRVNDKAISIEVKRL